MIHVNSREKSEETALERYKRLIDDYKDKYEEIGSRIQLLFPEKIFKQHQLLLRLFNEARTIINDTDLNPSSNPDYNQFRAKVDAINSTYFKYIEFARHYLGTDSLEPIGSDVAFTEELYGSQKQKISEETN